MPLRHFFNLSQQLSRHLKSLVRVVQQAGIRSHVGQQRISWFASPNFNSLYVVFVVTKQCLEYIKGKKLMHLNHNFKDIVNIRQQEATYLEILQKFIIDLLFPFLFWMS